jgi:hypothetical protein
MAEVLRPYIDGILARLNALQSVQEIAQAFLEGINSFFINKEVTYNLGTGIQIVSPLGQK